MSEVLNHRTDGEIGMVINHEVTDAVGDYPIREVSKESNEYADSEELSEKLGVRGHASRVFCITHKEDVVQFNQALKGLYPWISSHYREVGLEVAGSIIWNDSFVTTGNLLKNFRDYGLSVFFFGDKAHESIPNDSWHQIVKEMNEKNDFIILCQKLGLAIPKTTCFNSRAELDNANIDFSKKQWLKLSKSISGMGSETVKSMDEVCRYLENVKDGCRFQIQEDAGTDVFASAQYYISDAGLSFVATTEQILDGAIYKGNRGPVSYDLRPITDPVANYMYKNGMRGYFGIDVAVIKTNNGNQYKMLECNPRYTGASYPLLVARRLGARNWNSMSYDINHSSLDFLDLSELAYDRTKKNGVVVINWGSVLYGSIGVVFLGNNEEEILRIKEKFEKLI